MITVIGASGFVGTYLVSYLKELNIEVKAFDLYPIRGVKKLNICYKSEIAEAFGINTTAVVNLACRQPATDKRYNPCRYFSVNVEGLLNILEVCREKKIPKVISVISYLNTLEETRYSRYFGLFSISEEAAIDCLEFYNRNYDVRNVVIKVPPILGYGPHLTYYKDGKIIKSGLLTFIEKAQLGEPIEVWGDAETPRYILYVKDLVSIIVSLLDGYISEVHPASDFASLDTEVKAIIKIFSPPNRQSKIIYKPEVPNSVRQYPLQFAAHQGWGDWKPNYNLEAILIDIKKEMELKRFIWKEKK